MSAVFQLKKESCLNRFRILRELGRGAEGVVYLAADPELGRQVAIKTLSLGKNPDLPLADHLLDAAKTVSTLSHPNIVPVFETGIHEGQPFVVFEYVEGKTLASMIEIAGALPMARTVIMMSQILAGVAHVHANSILHGDLKPANILIGANGIPRVVDFGISRRVHKAVTEPVSAGTVPYMAPEFFHDGHSDYRSDVFALGLIFHEMLSGEPVIAPGNEYTQIYRIVNEMPQEPSAKNPRIAPEIDAIVLKALDKNPEKRFANAGEMKRELDRFRVPAAAADRVELQEQSIHSTVEFLLRRMALKSDFAALSASFTRINQLRVQADDTSLKALADIILRDFALTQKLLRLVNSAATGAGKVTKVSQAITLLGVSQLRSIATGMMLSSGGGAGPKSPEVVGALTDAFITGVISRNIGRIIGLAAVEELFLCGMFSRLGQILALYYLSEEYTEIARRVADDGIDAASASRAVLGLTFDQVGAAVARKWNFPDSIVSALSPLPTDNLVPATSEAERMGHCAGYARELCDVIRRSAAKDLERALQSHAARFAQVVPVELSQLHALIEHSIEVALKYVAASGLAQPKTALLDGLTALRATPAASPSEAAAPMAPASANENARTLVSEAESAQANDALPAQVAPPAPAPAPAPSGFGSKFVRAWRGLFGAST